MKFKNFLLNLGIALILSLGIFRCILDSNKEDCKCKKISYSYNSYDMQSTKEESISCTSELNEKKKSGQTVTLFEYDKYGRKKTAWQITCD